MLHSVNKYEERLKEAKQAAWAVEYSGAFSAADSAAWSAAWAAVYSATYSVVNSAACITHSAANYGEELEYQIQKTLELL